MTEYLDIPNLKDGFFQLAPIRTGYREFLIKKSIGKDDRESHGTRTLLSVHSALGLNSRPRRNEIRHLFIERIESTRLRSSSRLNRGRQA